MNSINSALGALSLSGDKENKAAGSNTVVRHVMMVRPNLNQMIFDLLTDFSGFC
jgi:hypothetical protein